MIVQCEFLTDPVGIDLYKPRFNWSLSHSEAVQKQTSYRIVVKKKIHGNNENSIVWDSGIVLSDRSNNVEYAGAPLETATEYNYTVTVTDVENHSITSNKHCFTTGIMGNHWKAAWLGGPWMEKHAFWFRSSFFIAKKVQSAYAFVISPNYYVLTINGKRCSDAVLQNATTDSKKTNLYATYKMDTNILYGDNVIGIEIGNGWHALNLGITNAGIGEHLFSSQIFIRYEDGSTEWIYSNPEHWKYTLHGPVGHNSIYHGEHYDARREITGWDTPEYDIDNAETEWFDAVEFEPEQGVVKAQHLEPIRVVSTIVPVQVYEVGDGSYTFDMGQNFAGWAKLKIEGPAGTHISLKYAELIHPDKTVNQISLRNMRATDDFILSGSGQEFYEPRFTFHGFRYVQVFGLPNPPKTDTITGCVVRSDVEQVGSFECDNRLLNQLQSNICWTEQSNLHGVPTDCPQRDERLGWINDMTVRNECALFNFRLSALYTKWLNDIMDTQGSVTGAISDTAPFRVFGSRPSDPVGACLFLIPWNMYRHYGDITIIKNCYSANVKFLHYLKKNSTDYIMRWATMGDWAAPIGDNDANSIGGGAVSMVTPPRLIATAFFYYDCVLMSKMAEAIGESQDAEFYEAESQKVKQAFIDTYYNHEKKYVYSNSQGCNTIALYFDLIPQQDRKQVFDHLINDIIEHQMHITTGNICTRYLIEILLTNGFEDIAYELLTQTTYPSWGYMIENGATTIWERWEKVEEECSLSQMASHNHPMYGAVGVSFFKHLAGIDADDKDTGFNKILIKPIIPSKLNHVKAKTNTISGEVISEWKKTIDGLVMNITVPFNCICELHVPSKAIPYEQLSISINGKKAIEKGEVIMRDEYVDRQDDAVIFILPSGKYTITRK